MLVAGLAPAQAPPPGSAAGTRWAPPPPLPSASALPYKPLVPADAPGARRPAAPTQPVLTLQKPAGADAPQPPAAPPPAQPTAPGDQTTDRNPAKAVGGRAKGTTDKAQLFGFEDDAALLKRITAELTREDRDRRLKVDPTQEPEPLPPGYFNLPTVAGLVEPGTRFTPKTLSYPPQQTLLEPGYVVHRRLYFEELNSERYGWEVGLAQPALSTLLFYKDTLLAPAKLASYMFERYETSAGKCLPGSPVPYLYYPEPVDAFGLLVGSATIVGSVGALGGL